MTFKFAINLINNLIKNFDTKSKIVNYLIFNTLNYQYMKFKEFLNQRLETFFVFYL